MFSAPAIMLHGLRGDEILTCEGTAERSEHTCVLQVDESLVAGALLLLVRYTSSDQQLVRVSQLMQSSLLTEVRLTQMHAFNLHSTDHDAHVCLLGVAGLLPIKSIMYRGFLQSIKHLGLAAVNHFHQQLAASQR